MPAKVPALRFLHSKRPPAVPAVVSLLIIVAMAALEWLTPANLVIPIVST
jgi:hypothetical protein